MLDECQLNNRTDTWNFLKHGLDFVGFADCGKLFIKAFDFICKETDFFIFGQVALAA